jgi:hypothetical protein
MRSPRDSWWRIGEKVVPYSEATAARLNVMMENFTRSVCDLVDFQREPKEGMW